MASALITSNCTASPSGFRATPSSTITFKTPGLLDNNPTNPDVTLGGADRADVNHTTRFARFAGGRRRQVAAMSAMIPIATTRTMTMAAMP